MKNGGKKYSLGKTNGVAPAVVDEFGGGGGDVIVFLLGVGGFSFGFSSDVLW